MSHTGAETQHQEDSDSSSGHYVEMSEQQSSRRTPKKTPAQEQVADHECHESCEKPLPSPLVRLPVCNYRMTSICGKLYNHHSLHE